MATIPESKPDRLAFRVEFNQPGNAQDLADLAKAFTYLADRTGVSEGEIGFESHEYDEDKQYATWETEGLG